MEVAMSTTSNDLENLMSKAQLLPNGSELDGIAMAIVRLQGLYRLEPKGMIGFNSQLTLDADECFHIAAIAQQNRQFHCAIFWIQETIRMLDEGTNAVVTKPQVMALANSVLLQDINLLLSLDVMQQAQQHGDLKTVPQLADSYNLLQSIKGWDGLEQSFNPFNFPDFPWRGQYEALCRGEGIKMDPQIQRKLVCRYTTVGGNPHMMYAPAKEEEEWDQPLILRYHDLMSVSETEIIKRLARPKLSRAKVSDPLTGEQIHTKVRISKSTWFTDDESHVVARVNKRIAEISGLNMETAEKLQIANYGIGGQYEPHYDAALINDSYFERSGKRIATVLIYMSDVEVGGSTVFPYIGAALRPKLGSAVIWFNLLKNGEEDTKTLHASCPVFVGSKWVANKWIRIRGQEFRRRCSLSEFE
ncbi:prolyl 4-hydroxylase subunit alpha-1 [Trichomycterus rosablanca]|uniref:prolyl 4-hydroxylase subunit alpha-1 n=1 Tax=Trichomycterus rosablanca TaxID=2290929 RepID=UPI002F357B23